MDFIIELSILFIAAAGNGRVLVRWCASTVKRPFVTAGSVSDWSEEEQNAVTRDDFLLHTNTELHSDISYT